MQTILGLIYTVLVIITIIDLVKSSKPNNQKIIWALVILLIPLAGLIAYYLVGKKK